MYHKELPPEREAQEARRFTDPDGYITHDGARMHLLSNFLPDGVSLPFNVRLRDHVARILEESGTSPADRNIHASAEQVKIWWNESVKK